MNTLNSTSIVDPTGKESTCAEFVIDDPSSALFLFPGVTSSNQKYTMSFWLKTSSSGMKLYVDSEETISFTATTDWKKYTVTFVAKNDDLHFKFGSAGTYHMYHLQLEQGDKATDWSPAPEDGEEATETAQQTANGAQTSADGAQASADAANQKANEAYDKATSAMASLELQEGRITALVESAVNASMMVHTENGWVFSMGAYNDRLDDIEAGLANMTEYVKIGRFYIDGDETNTDPDNVRPCIDLGESDTEFKARITNTSFDLMDNKEVKTRVDRDGISTGSIAAGGEFKQNNPNDSASGYFIWSVRANGNYGLTWKGVDD